MLLFAVAQVYIRIMDNTFLQARIDATKIAIVAIEDAVLALAPNGGINEYTLDTGQTRTRVTRQNITELNRMLDSMYNRLVTLEARLNGSGSVIMRML